MFFVVQSSVIKGRWAVTAASTAVVGMCVLAAINKRTWVRTVIVPGINDSKQILDEYIEIVKEFPHIEKYELLGFHTMGFFKYEQLGIENPLKDKEALDPNVLKELQNYVNEKLGK